MIAKFQKKNISFLDRKILILIISLLIIANIILFFYINLNNGLNSDSKITKYFQKILMKRNINSIPIFLRIVHILNNTYSPYFIITIIFNFFTSYDCFILTNILSVDYIITFCLKMIYKKANNGNDENKIIIFYCGYGWGFPSEECILMVSFYLSLWKIISKLSINSNPSQKTIKFLILLSFIILIIIFSFGILLMGYYYLSHIFFSILTGLIIYLIILESNFINLLNGKEFINFIKDKFIQYIIGNLIIFIILSIFYIIEKLNIKNDKKICTTIDNTKIFFKCGKSSYIDGSYSFVILFLGNIFAAIGVKLDIQLIYNGNESNYHQFNFPQEWDEIIDNKSRGSRDSLAESIIITKETLWNKTTLFISLLRLIIVLLFFGLCFIPYVLIDLTNSNIFTIYFIKFLLPQIFLYLGIFCYFKPILKLMKLTNFTLESILNDR